MKSIEHFNSMDGYTFDEGVAFLALVKSPIGVIRHIKATHNKNQLHSEIHRMLRMSATMRLLKEKGYGKEVAAKPQPTVSVPKSDAPRRDASNASEEIASNATDEINPDETDIILTLDDVRTHKYTRIDQMPNDLTRQLYLKKEDLFHEMQQYHLKMRNVPEGEEHNEERAKYRAKVLCLDAEVADYWKQIDAEIERFIAESERAKNSEKEEKPEENNINVSVYRTYISKALRKKKLTPAQLAELQHRVDALVQAKAEIKPETIKKLKAIGISIG